MHALTSGEHAGCPQGRLSAAPSWALPIGVVVAYLYLHELAAFTFPVPWEDESQYLWMAVTFADIGSLHAPQVSSRPLFMMPFGHMVVVGTLFKLFGVSLALARWVSALWMVGSFVLLASLTARYGLRFFSLLFCAAYLCSRTAVAAGNIGRMEAFVLFTACLGFWLLQRGRPYRGLAVLLIGPLIHPNGTYFLAAAGAYVLVTGQLTLRLRGLTRRDVAYVLVALTLWGVYGYYVATHWPLFEQDMAYQFGVKLGRDVRGQLLNAGNVPALLAVALCIAYAIWARLDVIFLLVLGIPAWLVYGVGHEMWYRQFDVLFYALLSIVVLHVVCDLAGHLSPLLRGKGRYAVASVTTAALVWWNQHTGRFEYPGDFPFKTVWGQMRIRPDVTYVTDTDVGAVGAFLDSLPSAATPTPVRVRFYPEADSLLFAAWRHRGVEFSQPFFSGMGEANVYIVHTSRALPAWMQKRAQQELGDTPGHPAGAPRLLRRRDGTEAWYYRVARAPSPAGR